MTSLKTVSMTSLKNVSLPSAIAFLSAIVYVILSAEAMKPVSKVDTPIYILTQVGLSTSTFDANRFFKNMSSPQKAKTKLYWNNPSYVLRFLVNQIFNHFNPFLFGQETRTKNHN